MMRAYSLGAGGRQLARLEPLKARTREERARLSECLNGDAWHTQANLRILLERRLHDGGSSPALPPTNTASGTGSFASALGATPGTAYTLPHPNASAFSRMSRTPVALRSTAHTDPARATSAASIDTLPVPAPTSHTVSVAVRRSFASATARTSCLVMGTSPRMKSSSGMPEEAYGQRELAARDAPAESTTEEVAAGADEPAGASEAAR